MFTYKMVSIHIVHIYLKNELIKLNSLFNTVLALVINQNQINIRSDSIHYSSATKYSSELYYNITVVFLIKLKNLYLRCI